MKKIVFSLIGMTLTAYFCQAQSIRYGFTAGLVYANYAYKGDYLLTDEGKPKTGFTAGAVAEVTLGKRFTFQPAVNFLQKGKIQKETFVGHTETTTLGVNYIEVPLNILFNGTDNKAHFFFGAGPSLSVAISGKLKFDDGKDGTNSGSATVHFGTGDDDIMKGTDLGANFLIGGYFFKSLLLSANYNLGLSNLNSDEEDNGTLKSSYFGIRLGYLLNKKARK